MSVWQFIPTDKHDITHLLEVEEFYKINSLKRLAELKKYSKLERYGLPGYRYEMIRREQGYFEAVESLENVRKAIEKNTRDNLES